MPDEKRQPTQEECRQLVAREVYYCVSSLIHELAQDEKYMDDLMPVLSQDDWQSPAEYEGYVVFENDSGEYQWAKPRADDDPVDPDELEGLDDDERELKLKYSEIGDDEHDTEADAWRDACESNRIDPEQREAYEHWIVSDWLARKLEERGEMVMRDFLGLTIWGRCTTGQAILLDGVITEIWMSTQHVD
jgi:hypothetical protein